MQRLSIYIAIASTVLTLGCSPATTQTNNTSLPLGKLWYEGKAEVSTYTLSQNRYQDVHPGTATIIYVTEDFLPDKNVKNESYTSNNSIKVLKSNTIYRFTTGMYDYSIYTSTFTNDAGAMEKISLSSQDWCGQTWLQLSAENDKYQVDQRSYFEREGDRTVNISKVLTEDQLWHMIRRSPGNLPKGEVTILPAAWYLTLKHLPIKPVKALIRSAATTTLDGKAVQLLNVTFPDLQRSLEITFEEASPHQILGWKDTYPSAFDRQLRTTIAELKSSLWTDYWSQNRLCDTTNRALLGF